MNISSKWEKGNINKHHQYMRIIRKIWPSLTNEKKIQPSLGPIDEKEMTITSKWKGNDHHYQMTRRRWPLSRPIDEKKTIPHNQNIRKKQMSSSQWPAEKKEMNIIVTNKSKEKKPSWW